MLFLGRHVGYPVALEGALKLKELAYMHAEGFAAGELKHGPIALIEEGVPVSWSCRRRAAAASLHDKIVSNIQEVRARGARTIVIAEEGDDDGRAVRRRTSIRVPAYADAAAAAASRRCRCRCSPARWPPPRGHDVDQPRNLAKSVTVE